MRTTELPSPSEFIAAAKAYFSYLESNGFRVSSEVRGTGETVTFQGAYAAVAISTDRRDGEVDLSIAELSGDGTTPRWQSFFGFLVSSASYRGSLREFHDAGVQSRFGQPQLQVFASALRHFLPRLVAGAEAPLTLGPTTSPRFQ